MTAVLCAFVDFGASEKIARAFDVEDLERTSQKAHTRTLSLSCLPLGISFPEKCMGFQKKFTPLPT